MIKVGVRVENHGDRQPELLHLVENVFVGPAWIDYDSLLRDWIAYDGTVATQRRH